MKKNRRTLLEIMVENGNSTEEIMKYKDCWGWKETTVEDYQEKMRKELESYGIPTKSLFEKSEFVEALKKARVEGKKPKKERKTASTKQSSSAAPSDTTTREERYQKAFEQAQSMGVKDLKQELKNRGISTASFFEKSEFIKAYAEAVADKKGKDKKVEEEPQDPSYRDVVMQKFDRRQLAGQSVIEIRLPR